MSEYRPKGWDAEQIAKDAGEIGNDEQIGLVEAGADAMYQPAYDKGVEEGKRECLQELRKTAMVLHIKNDKDIMVDQCWRIGETSILSESPSGKMYKFHRDGTLVFIPDEKE